MVSAIDTDIHHAHYLDIVDRTTHEVAQENAAIVTIDHRAHHHRAIISELEVSEDHVHRIHCVEDDLLHHHQQPLLYQHHRIHLVQLPQDPVQNQLNAYKNQKHVLN